MAIAFLAGYTPSSRTTIRRKANVRSRVAESGKLRYVNIAAQTYHNVLAVFEQMTEAEKETLMDWLITNELAEIDLAIGSETYRGYVDPRGQISQTLVGKTGHLWNLSVPFIGIKQ